MKRLRKNYWLMIVAWCLILNDFPLLGCLVGLTSCIVLSIQSSFHKASFIMITITYIGICFLLLASSRIPYYFKGMYALMTIVSFNVSLVYEKLKTISYRNTFQICFVIFLLMGCFLLITSILPNSAYSIFTKKNLVFLILLIFFPYETSSFAMLLQKYNHIKQLRIRKGACRS